LQCFFTSIILCQSKPKPFSVQMFWEATKPMFIRFICLGFLASVIGDANVYIGKFCCLFSSLDGAGRSQPDQSDRCLGILRPPTSSAATAAAAAASSNIQCPFCYTDFYAGLQSLEEQLVDHIMNSCLKDRQWWRITGRVRVDCIEQGVKVGVWARAVPFPDNFLVEFSSKKMHGFYAFLLQNTTCGLKPGPVGLIDLFDSLRDEDLKRMGVENLVGV